MYEVYLVVKDTIHTETIFNEFLYKQGKKLCKEHGNMTYVDGEIKCSVHAKDMDEEVPFGD